MEPEITKAEREELLASMHKWHGGHWLHPEHPIYKQVCNALPRLLRALDAAEEDLAASETAIDALDCHYGASEELGHDCHDATPCMREKLEAQRDAAGDERDALKARLDAAEARIQQVHDWYADRWARLRAFLAKDSPMEKGACDIMANGHLLADHDRKSAVALATERAEAAEAERDRMRNEADGYQRLAKESQESQDKSALLVIGPVDDEFRVYGPTPNSEERFAKTFADYWKLINEVARSIEADERAKKAEAERDAAESLAWDALGRPDGTYEESNVQRLCAAYGALKAKMEVISDAAEHLNDCCVGMGVQPYGCDCGRFTRLDAALADAAEAENDALKAKLAALVEAMGRIVALPEEETTPWIYHFATKALAAAKEPQP